LTITLPAAGSALLRIDVINDLSFEDSAALVALSTDLAFRPHAHR
jgi:hypothetical protein